MGQKKGQTGNPNGRPKGTPNRTTKEIKQLIVNIISEQFETINKDFEQLEPLQRLQMIDRLLSYIVPKAQTIEVETKDTTPLEKDLENLTYDEKVAKLSNILEKLRKE